MFQEDTTPTPPAKPAFPRAAGIVLTAVVVLLAVGGYAAVSSRLNQSDAAQSQRIAALEQQVKEQAGTVAVLQDRLHLSDSELAQLRSAAADAQSRLNQAQTAFQKQASDLAAAEQRTATDLASVKQDTGQQLGAINGSITGVKGDVSQTRTDLAKTQSDLEATQASLKTAIGDLGVQSGLIATTRTDLDALERRGERTITEFKLDKTKEPQRVGPVELKLDSVDVKHGKYSVDVIADDARITKKDKTLDEPVQFYTNAGRTSRALNEMVVYQINKNEIIGYISSPKYADTAASNPNPGSGH